MASVFRREEEHMDVSFLALLPARHAQSRAEQDSSLAEMDQGLQRGPLKYTLELRPAFQYLLVILGLGFGGRLGGFVCDVPS